MKFYFFLVERKDVGLEQTRWVKRTDAFLNGFPEFLFPADQALTDGFSTINT